MKLILVWLWCVQAQIWRIQPVMEDTLDRKHALCLQTVVTPDSRQVADLWNCSAFGDARDEWIIQANKSLDLNLVSAKSGGCLAFDQYESDPRGASVRVGEVSCTDSKALWTRDLLHMQFINKYTGLCLQIQIPAGSKPASGCKAAGDSDDSLGCVHLFVCDDPFDNRTMWHLDLVTPSPTAPTPPTPTTQHPTHLTHRPTHQSPTTAAPSPLPPTSAAPTPAAPTLSPTTSSPTTGQLPTVAPTQAPTKSPTSVSPTTTSPTSPQPTLPPSAPYVNHFSTVDNAYAMPVSPKDGMNVIFVVGDFGSFNLLNSSKCCQNKVAQRMLAKRALLESQGYNVLFVAALGDNFYWTGVCPEKATPDYGPCYTQSSGLQQWQHWASTYGNLTNLPWLGVMGNHDFGNSDVYAMCPEKAPRVNIDGQTYACNALDADKGGYRPIPESANFHMPDFNYRYTVNQLNLEVYVLDQNALYLSHIGGDASGRVFVNKVCGDDNYLESRLTRLKDSGEQMMAYWSQQGPAFTNQTRNVLLIQHYPGPCEDLKALFRKSVGKTNYTIDIRCVFGHNHDTQCRDPAKPSIDKCADILLGAGGGCCSGDPVESGAAGFGVIYLSQKGMKLEVVTDAGSCSVCTTGAKWWTENLGKMEEYWAENPYQERG